MALFSPFGPWWRGDQSIFDTLDDHPFLNINSSFFRDANIARANRANVSETETGYKVEIEVPGYQKSEISIEFGPDGKTLTVSGNTAKSFEQGPADNKKGVTVEEVPEREHEKSSSKSAAKSSQQSPQQVAERNKEQSVSAPAGPKYWISERTVDSFSRTFSFATPLDHEKATANLENGVLTIDVPKATKAAVKKISIA